MKHGWFKVTPNHYELWLNDNKVGSMKVKKQPGSKSGTPNAFALVTKIKYWRGTKGKSLPYKTRKEAQDSLHNIIILHKQKYGKKLENWHYTGE